MRLHRHRLAVLLSGKLLNERIGTKFDIVTGYKGGQEIDLAVEKGEVDCRAFTVTTYFAREPFISWRKKNFVRVLVSNRQEARRAFAGGAHRSRAHR